ncbi:MAG: phospholipase D-like domain-containing protein [Candidatus Omnitrophica bacterium]|nr:phospholipase D-like domain-containing protein [Candidatus Omnitrophota bacterium]MCM8829739.1 phospholipase D-like domain-containing protein [Candidatus Omnitrophota bacterium]
MRKLVLLLLVFLHPSFSENIPSLYFTPNPKTDKIIISLMEGAESSIYIAGYSVSWGKMIELLNREKWNNIDIKILTDRETKWILKDIVRIYDKPGLFHPKFIVVDKKYVLIGSGNFTDDGIYLHHNHFLLIKDRNIADFLNKKFLSWWDDKPAEEPEVYEDEIYQIYFSPETNCESIIIQNISNARKSIHFLHYQFTSEEIAKVIIRKKLSGVDVYGILEPLNIEPYSVFYPLIDYGCRLKKSNRAGFLHDKLFIIDEEIVITGSYNPTASARKNTECLLIIKDKETAKKFLKEWKKLWLFYSVKP